MTETMAETMHPSDVLVGIGHNLPVNRRGFRHSHDKFHVFMYERRKRFPEIFGRFMFDSNGNYPISRELDEAVSSLTCSGLLCFSLGRPGYYQFDPAVDISYGRVSERIDNTQAQGLAQIAQEFDREFGQENRFSH